MGGGGGCASPAPSPVIIHKNRPFPSLRLPPLQSESKCDVFVIEISYILHMNESNFQLTQTLHLYSL